MFKEYEKCQLCPRNCNADRKRIKGYCRASDKMEICRIGLHFMEEPVISGTNGSGTVFFAHCNLGCVYCQNFEISHTEEKFKIFDYSSLAEKMLELESSGAHNINLVTPTHYMPEIKKACLTAKERGLGIPIVYNTSGFEKPEIIKTLSDFVDIYLTDLKYFSPYLSGKYSLSEDYFDFASASIEQMINNVGSPKINTSGIMDKGVIIRHLVLPTLQKDSVQVLKYIYKHWKDKVFVSLMRQYTPVCENLPAELKREVTDAEYSFVLDAFNLLELEGFIQDGSSAGTEKIPKWDLKI